MSIKTMPSLRPLAYYQARWEILTTTVKTLRWPRSLTSQRNWAKLTKWFAAAPEHFMQDTEQWLQAALTDLEQILRGQINFEQKVERAQFSGRAA